MSLAQLTLGTAMPQDQADPPYIGQDSHTAGAPAEQVSDTLVAYRMNLPAAPYEELKAALLDRTASSVRARIQQLRTTVELGDRRPTQLLRQMMQLLGSCAHALNNAVLRELFVQRLPSNVQKALATAFTVDLPSLAALAHKVMEEATQHLQASVVMCTS
ncbi:hypothetical protein MRX96_027424 [Rhipicephalus microplus]